MASVRMLLGRPLVRDLWGRVRGRSNREVLTGTELLTRFESLGFGCEFGTIQRFCLSEPQGLFRFNGSSLDNFTDVIERGVSGLYADKDMELFEYDGHDEYMVKSRSYDDFIFHTQYKPSEISRETVVPRLRRRLRFLKEKFEEDLAAGEKVFVRMGKESEAGIVRLHEALQRSCPATLLWVAPASEAHPAGTMETMRETLFRGYIAKFKNFSKDEPADLESWISICQQAYRRHWHVLHARGPLAARAGPRLAYEPVRPISRGNAWMFGGGCEVGGDFAIPAGDGPGMSSAKARTLTLKQGAHEEALAYVAIRKRLRPGAIVVFSVWIRMVEGTDVYKVDAWFLNLPHLHGHACDPSIGGRWQRVWITAEVPRDATKAIAVVRVGGGRGGTIELSSWSLEEGVVPGDPRAGGP